MTTIEVYELDWEKTGVPLTTVSIPARWKEGLFAKIATFEISTNGVTEEERTMLCDKMFAMFNRGSGEECPQLEGHRSLSIGDVVKIDQHHYICAGAGWKEFKVDG